MNEERFQKFVSVFRKHLEKAISEQPKEYAWSISEMEVVMGRMAAAIRKLSFDKESPSFRKTCKELKINHTYMAIEKYLKGET